MKILSGHVSPETAYVVDDYPYGFRLRCKIRYWLDSDPRKGSRLMSQTTNPKRAGEVWNKPKASTYCRFGGCMVLNEKDHVTWTGLSEYTEHEKVGPWLEKYRSGVPTVMLPVIEAWVKVVAMYDAAKKEKAA